MVWGTWEYFLHDLVGLEEKSYIRKKNRLGYFWAGTKAKFKIIYKLFSELRAKKVYTYTRGRFT